MSTLVTDNYHNMFTPLLVEAELAVPVEMLKGTYSVDLHITKAIDYYHISIMLNLPQNPGYERQLLTVKVNFWKGCCALVYLSYLRLDSLLKNSKPFLAAFEKVVLQKFIGEALGFTRCYFSYSEEEVTYHHAVVEKLGFTEEGFGDGYVSVGTNHMIHTAYYNTASQKKIDNAIQIREDGFYV